LHFIARLDDLEVGFVVVAALQRAMSSASEAGFVDFAAPFERGSRAILPRSIEGGLRAVETLQALSNDINLAPHLIFRRSSEVLISATSFFSDTR